ncbi:hypothetical protein E2C01_045531 [Portunus trituberculatus]|uniref:Uncharacterized protein n=1 Tax=Portunus trituberculatus TaxID=210409 RepID=A0A5B7G2B7_PORTR|nr:hypothetical protein [Portunus trituberculatus]
MLQVPKESRCVLHLPNQYHSCLEWEEEQEEEEEGTEAYRGVTEENMGNLYAVVRRKWGNNIM